MILREGNSDSLGKHLYYFSNERGFLSSFPWWDHEDKQIASYSVEDIPLGTLSKPYNDCEQSWQIIIFKKRNYVCILQGDEPTCTNFNAWYKVRIEDYLDNWNILIEYLKENVDG
ncbi:hypothetical protein J2736_003020 [Paenibacillus qinlingensis]|uniref:Uncharacterized protein n=1 Tax=Paenibacillus qinlingensis TaxID=1837343 RepID=A0ABU1NWI8_9BACL|nr:hypothetical protein [Paenibacillus qinlingensis]